MNTADELERLQRLRDSGALTEEEFVKAKENLLNPPPSSGPGFNLNLPGTRDQQVKQWAMFLHLSQLAGYAAPIVGLVVPIIIWQIKKDEFPEIDIHGKIVVNWLISLLIYTVVGAILSLVGVGILILLVLGILGVVFPIIGGLKANNGEVWEYPGTIKFIQ